MANGNDSDPQPFVEAKPGDPITASNWNNMQVALRRELRDHDHTDSGDGGLQGQRIGSDALEENAVTTEKIKAGAITAAQIKDGTITAKQIEDGTITTDKIEAGAITQELLSSDIELGGGFDKESGVEAGVEEHDGHRFSLLRIGKGLELRGIQEFPDNRPWSNASLRFPYNPTSQSDYNTDVVLEVDFPDHLSVWNDSHQEAKKVRRLGVLRVREVTTASNRPVECSRLAVPDILMFCDSDQSASHLRISSSNSALQMVDGHNCKTTKDTKPLLINPAGGEVRIGEFVSTEMSHCRWRDDENRGLRVRGAAEFRGREGGLIIENGLIRWRHYGKPSSDYLGDYTNSDWNTVFKNNVIGSERFGYELLTVRADRRGPFASIATQSPFLGIETRGLWLSRPDGVFADSPNGYTKLDGIRVSFRKRDWTHTPACLFEVIDIPEGNDLSDYLHPLGTEDMVDPFMLLALLVDAMKQAKITIQELESKVGDLEEKET